MSLNPLSGQPGSTVTPTVLVDPTSPTNVLKINADGSINTSGGGTGGGSDVTIHDNTTTSYHLKINADGSLNTAVVSGGGGVASSVALNDATTTANHLKINSDGSINVNPSSSSSSTALNDGTTTTQKLAIDASGKVGINNFPGSQAVTGSVSVSNLPGTQPVSGSVSVSNLPGTQPVSGSVSVGNFPATQPVSGTVAVSNFPAASSTVTIADPTTGTQKLAVDATGKIGINNLPGTQPVSGSVSVSNLPATQPVSGILNLADPTTTTNKLKVNADGSINVTGGTGGGSGSTIITDGTTTTQKLAVDASGKVGINNFPATQPVSGSVSVSNLPGTQPVSGSVSVSNLPGTQPVSGSVAVSNLPGTQPVSGSITLAAGSALAGGVNLVDSAGTNKAAVDASGNLSVKVTSGGGGGSSVFSTQDGLTHATVPETALAGYASGGPPLVSGLASGLDTERLRTWLGKGKTTAVITSTSIGDTSLTCAAGVLNLLSPGQLVRLGASNLEYVIVSTSYVPSTGAISIPLQSPVLFAGHTQAQFDSFSVSGANGGAVLGSGLLMQMPTFFDTTSGNIYAAMSAGADNVTPAAVPEVITGFLTGTLVNRQQGRNGASEVAFGGRTSYAIAAGLSTNTILLSGSCRLGQVLVTAVGTNNMYFYDNNSAASGTIVAIIPSTATLGQLFVFQMPCAFGLTVLGNAGNPGITVIYSN